MRTDDLISDLARDAHPVRRLGSPWARLSTWLAVSVAFATANVLAMSPRADLALKMTDPAFALELSGAVGTAILAGLAALSLGVPGRPAWERGLWCLPFIVWVGTLSTGCLQALMHIGPDGIKFAPDLVCFPYIALGASVPSLLIFWLVSRAAPMAPVPTAMLAALASAALAAATLRLYHTQDASLMILVWQFGSVAILALLGGLLGRRLLRWPTRAPG